LPSAVPIIWAGPRPRNSMNGSPAISSDVRVHRVHEMHRSRFQQHLGGDGDRLVKGALVEGEPGLTPPRWTWPGSAAGTRPPLSHTRAIERVVDESSISITPCCALSATAEVSWVCTTMPSVARGDARGQRLALAFHLDQALAAGADRFEQRVFAEPRDRDAEQFGGPG